MQKILAALGLTLLFGSALAMVCLALVASMLWLERFAFWAPICVPGMIALVLIFVFAYAHVDRKEDELRN